MRHWPLMKLQVTMGDLTLRLPREDELDALAQVAAEGVHAPGQVCFPQPWASGTPEERARSVLQNHWWARGDWQVENWRLLLAVFADGQVIGQQNLSSRNFSTTREARTGFWLGQRFQGLGYGTQMRAAILGFAFGWLGAERVASSAFRDNTPSRRISEKFGYESNGIRRISVGGKLVEVHDTVILADRWGAYTGRSVTVTGCERCRGLFESAY